LGKSYLEETRRVDENERKKGVNPGKGKESLKKVKPRMTKKRK